jgi:flagellar biogenesis protein FliO
VIFSYLLTLFGVCGLAAGSLVVLRAAKGGGLLLGAAQPIRVVGRQTLGAGASLMLVEVDGQRMLIAVARGGVSVLTGGEKIRSPEPVEGRFTQPTPLRQAPDSGGSFRTALKRAGSRW